MSERLKRMLEFLEQWVRENDESLLWGDGTIQTFTTRNMVGDFMYTIYDEDGIQVDFAPSYIYIEVFGLKENEEELLFQQQYIY